MNERDRLERTGMAAEAADAIVAALSTRLDALLWRRSSGSSAAFV